MSKSENDTIGISPQIANIYVELGFLNETLNALMDLTKDQGKAITAILTHLNKKQEK